MMSVIANWFYNRFYTIDILLVPRDLHHQKIMISIIDCGLHKWVLGTWEDSFLGSIWTGLHAPLEILTSCYHIDAERCFRWVWSARFVASCCQ